MCLCSCREREKNDAVDGDLGWFQRDCIIVINAHAHFLSSHNSTPLHYTTLLSPSSLYPTNKQPRFSQTNQLTTTSFNLFPPKSARCSSVCFQTTDTASQSSPPSLPPPHFDASNSLAAAPSARLRTPSATPSRSTQSPLSFAAPAFYSVNSLSLPCFGTNCSWFVRMSRRREVVHFPNFILK